MKILEEDFDKRSECFSILTTMTLHEYKELVYQAFERGGNIDGQRDVIKKSTVASKIKKRMNDDFIAGAIFPHVVIGLLVSNEKFESLKTDVEGKSSKFNPRDYDKNEFSIIDGMQRSFIYFSNYDGFENRCIRVEFWISNKSVKLLYRMLVLNTGQVPWNTRRQVEVIFANLSQSIIERLTAKEPELARQVAILGVDENRRRTQACKYQKATMIELYLGFNTRKAKVDVNDELADEFQRFDMMESIEKEANFDLFVDAFSYLCKLDIAFSSCTSQAENGQYKIGKDIFGSVPACLGFVVACAEYIMGKIPVERSEETKAEKVQKLESQIKKILAVINEHKEENFLNLNTLNLVIGQLPKNRIGDEMRNYFKQVFSELLKYDDIEEINSMEAFWRS